MSGLARAELLRLRKRRSVQVIILAVPLLVAFFFVLGAGSLQEQPPFDAVAYRQQLVDEGIVIGLPPEEAERLLDELVESARQDNERMAEYFATQRASFALPDSLVTVFGFGTFAYLALVLLAATVIGDEFGWGTLRTSLIANTDRRRFFGLRLLGLALIAVLVFALLIALGIVLPLLLSTANGRLPNPMPAFNGVGFLALVAGQLLASAVVFAFAALATLMVRSGGLTLVVVLVYVAIEASILAVLLRFQDFQDNGRLAWTLDLLPVRGIATLTGVASRAASGLPQYGGDVLSRDLAGATVPVVALLAWGTLFGALAFRRFQRMDIVE